MGRDCFLAKYGNNTHKLEALASHDPQARKLALTPQFIEATSPEAILNALRPDRALAPQVRLVSGNIFEQGFGQHDAMALWFKTGFTRLSAEVQKFLSQLSAPDIKVFVQRNGGWQRTTPDEMIYLRSTGSPYLFKVLLADGAAKYVYVQPNADNGMAATQQVADMTRDALETLFSQPVKSICFNGIQGANGSRNAHIDKIHAAVMLRAVHDYVTLNQLTPEFMISLIDIRDGFTFLLNEQNA